MNEAACKKKVKRTRLRSIIVASHFATGLFLMRRSTEFSSLPLSNHVQADTRFSAFVEKSLGTDG